MNEQDQRPDQQILRDSYQESKDAELGRKTRKILGWIFWPILAVLAIAGTAMTILAVLPNIIIWGALIGVGMLGYWAYYKVRDKK